MGVPWFPCRKLAREHGGVALSSHYALYADLGARLMAVLGQFAPRQAIYSIDECFLDLAEPAGSEPTPLVRPSAGGRGGRWGCR